MEDVEYKKIFIDSIGKKDTQYGVEKLLNILSEYKYPEELAELKAKKDTLIASISLAFKNNPNRDKIMDNLELFFESNKEEILKVF